jgi:hypothetical protein
MADQYPFQRNQEWQIKLERLGINLLKLIINLIRKIFEIILDLLRHSWEMFWHPSG